MQHIGKSTQDGSLACAVHAEEDVHALPEGKLKVVKHCVVSEVYACEQHDPSPLKGAHGGQAP